MILKTPHVSVPVAYTSEEISEALLTALVENATQSAVYQLVERSWPLTEPIQILISLCPDGRMP
jgi:uncharacterized membrane protein